MVHTILLDILLIYELIFVLFRLFISTCPFVKRELFNIIFSQVSGMANENTKHIIIEFFLVQEFFHEKICNILNKITLVLWLTKNHAWSIMQIFRAAGPTQSDMSISLRLGLYSLTNYEDVFYYQPSHFYLASTSANSVFSDTVKSTDVQNSRKMQQ